MPQVPEATGLTATHHHPRSDLAEPSRRPSDSDPSDPGETACEVTIERDLAVQLVGSDAGKARRMRPHGAMTKGSTDDEVADVRAVMEPFLGDEIRRVHEDRTQRPRLFLARATLAQAASLKTFCLRFAASLELNLEKHPGDDNRHRSQQRLDQARRVIVQVNTTLDIPHDDGRTLDQVHKELIVKLVRFSAEIGEVCDRAVAIGKLDTVRPLLEIRDAMGRLAERTVAP